MNSKDIDDKIWQINVWQDKKKEFWHLKSKRSEVHFTVTSWYSAEHVVDVIGRHSFSVKWDSDIKRVAGV